MGCPKLTYNLTTEPRLRCVYSAAEEEEGRVASRTGMIDQTTETFKYDDLDRLTHVKHNNIDAMEMEYQSNGNIFTKTGLGEYAYHPTQVHAVEYIDNTDDLRNPRRQEIEYNAFNKATLLIDTVGNDAYQLKIFYGPDQQRWKTVLKKNGVEIKRILYVGDYEVVTENGGAPQEMIYLTGGSLHVTQNSQSAIYYTHKDHLGSIISITDNAGNYVFKASYDAWGLQTIDPNYNTFKFHRGYTGHEHLPEFGLINMNGRMYDPIVGRFLSPDPYVQAPDFSQGYNRYSYCLNNPLKYSDPTGEKWWHWALGIADFLGGGVLSAAALITAHNVSSMALITAHNVSSLGIGLAGFASTIPVTPGIISGTAAVAGVSGFTLAGAVGGVGIGNGLANSFLVWIGSGFNINGDFYNGKGTGKRFGNAWKLSWGMFKTDKDLNFFQRYWQFMSRYTYEMPVTAFGQAFHGFANAFSKGDVTVDYFHGATVLQAEWMGSGGVTLGSNITIGYRGGAGGTYGGIDADNPTLLHEYGHYLQTRRYGNMSWYNMAFSSLTTPSSMTHMDNWTERDANYRAARYFQNKITPDQYNNFLTEYTGYFNSYGYRLGLGYLMPFEIFTNLFWR